MGVSASCNGSQCGRRCGSSQVEKILKHDEQLGCVQHCHVQALIASLPPDTLRELLGQSFHDRCCAKFRELDRSENGFLENEELTEACRGIMPPEFAERLHVKHISALALAFDENQDGSISHDEFSAFCIWVSAMQLHGFFSGTGPLAKIADAILEERQLHDRLILVSELLDPEHILQACVLPSVFCVYYHPDSLTMDEFSAQLETAAYIRSKRTQPYKSVALANHGPSEDGYWYVCADHSVEMKSTDTAWSQLMSMFLALADMVATTDGEGNVDLLACSFAARPAGVECVKMIQERTGAKFSASVDATGNVADGGDWELEVGSRNVAPIYFDESKLKDFHRLMKFGMATPSQERRVSRVNHKLDDVCVGAGGPQYAKLKGKREQQPSRLRPKHDFQKDNMERLQDRRRLTADEKVKSAIDDLERTVATKKAAHNVPDWNDEFI
eukprot:TRINITY_DN39921_c0_g1_i1.p1 TRINITY_DN39921_c0_g1~~TRINITY_DN39921_c0_g1_i1.p1  ORF type:complete len:467 (+),score=51.38 TRINITY_DN39921_c0_g1_i1:71-1402(+)